MQQILHAVLDEMRGAVRFRLPALLAAWAICLLGWGLVLMLPDVYQASARVFADTRTALAPVIQGLAIQQDVAAQLNLVEQSLLGEEQLERVIEGTGLAAKANTPGRRARVMENLRKHIEINVYPSSERGDSGSVYWLGYRDSDRQRALKVIEILLNAFMADTVSGKIANSEAAQEFLTGQIQATELQLRAAEQRLADFKKRNVGTMPGAEGDYFTRLQNEIDAARTARTSLSVAVSRRDELSKQLHDGALLAASSGSAPPPVSSNQSSARDTLTQLAEAQAKLDALLRQYTERHPDVGTLRETIAALKAQHERELEALRRGDSDTALPAGVTSNPVYQSVRLALNQANVEVAALSRQLAAHETKVADLRRLVNSMPEVEAEFARLNRDYDVHKSQYVALVDRLEKAKLGQDAESTGSGVRLEVLDPPTAPYRPVAPQRPKLVVLVLMFAVGAATGLAFVLSRLNPVFNHSRELEQITGLPVLGEVSLTWLQKYNRAALRGLVGYSAAAAALFGVCVLLVALQLKAT